MHSPTLGLVTTIAAAWLSFSACAQEQPPRVNEWAVAGGPACDIDPLPSVARTMSPRQRCVYNAHRARCAYEDVCLLQCLYDDSGRDIGGGCWHTCFAYSGVRYTEPPAVASCNALSDSVPPMVP
jgi:hypothetical protein